MYYSPFDSSCVSLCVLGSAGTAEATPVIANVVSLAHSTTGISNTQRTQQHAGVYELYVNIERESRLIQSVSSVDCLSLSPQTQSINQRTLDM